MFLYLLTSAWETILLDTIWQILNFAALFSASFLGMGLEPILVRGRAAPPLFGHEAVDSRGFQLFS